MLPVRLIIATSNLGKLKEFEALLAPIRVEGIAGHRGVVLPDETGASYAENARLKAEAVMKATGIASLGDDSGLEVTALGGAPGLYSARYEPNRFDGESQDAANRRKLLESLSRSGVPAEDWQARFVCALALASPGEETRVFMGAAAGRVLAEPRGTHGFGYDPLLLITELGKTFAELPEEQKNWLSHRGLAVRALLAEFGN